MENGTYLVLDGDKFITARIETGRGYWVAETELDLADVKSGDVIGIWTDTDTGKVWVDRSRFFTELDTALFWAKQWNQLAIWDNANGVEVRL